MRKFALILLTSMVCVLSMAQSDEIVFTPQWTAQAQFAGYYAALEKGFYKEAGLKVTIKHPSPSNSSVNMLKEGKAFRMDMGRETPLKDCEISRAETEAGTWSWVLVDPAQSEEAASGDSLPTNTVNKQIIQIDHSPCTARSVTAA